MKDTHNFGFKISKVKKRRLKKGETEYPQYKITTIQELFDILTPENMNRFFKQFKVAMSASVYMRQMVHEIAKAEAKKEGVEIPFNPSDAMKMPSYTWIDD